MVAKVIHIITKLELGGAQQNTLYTVGHLDPDKFKTYLITGDDGILDDEAYDLLKDRFFKVKSLVREISPLKDIKALFSLSNKIKDIRDLEPKNTPVIVHTHSSKAGILGRIAARMARADEIIHSYHGFGFNDWQKAIVKWAFVLAERITKPLTDAFICVSRKNIEKGIKHKVLREQDTVLIRSGINISIFSAPTSEDRVSKRSEIGVSDDTPIIGMVACFKPQKAPLDFIEMAAKVHKKCPDAVFYAAGDGILRPEIENKISELGLKDKVKLLGWRRDMPELMAAFDVLVLTSLWEGLPRVIPQAMAAGKPVVATSVDGSAEVVRHGVTGYLVEPGDMESAARHVVELANSPALSEKMGTEAANLVKEFDIDLMVRQQEELYLSLLEKSG